MLRIDLSGAPFDLIYHLQDFPTTGPDPTTVIFRINLPSSQTRSTEPFN
jgi:hypothetical protein